MKNLVRPAVLMFLFAVLSFCSCNKPPIVPGGTVIETGGTVNKPPVATAGYDQTIALPVDSIILDGSASNDSDGNIAAWQWTQISGPSSLTISNANSVKTRVTKLVEGSYEFELKVTDAGGLFDKDTIHIMVLASIFDGREIYIAGRGTVSGATLWHNGTLQVLTGVAGTTALSLFVNGNDVYVAGGAYNHWFGFDTTFVWKNGVVQNLDRKELAGATSVFVSGNDVYAAGWGDDGAVLWKNGQATSLGNEGANALFLSGSDVYVAGWERRNIGQTQALVAKYWKNGASQTLSTGGSGISVANYVFVFKSDVYVAGHNGYVATLWKNGVPQILGQGEAQSVYVINGDVYVVGSSNGNATLWKNGVGQILGRGVARSVYILNGEVYVAGYEGIYTNGILTQYAKLWRNGVEYAIPGLSEANSIFVK